MSKSIKPLGHKAYGSIPHLPGSRRGPADKGLSEQQAKILTEKARDKHDLIIVQEKLDGSNVSVANIDGELVALTRAGYMASTSPFKQHHYFEKWVNKNIGRFQSLLAENARVCGEWLMEAHGTKYDLPHAPFVAFDIFYNNKRMPWGNVSTRCEISGIVTPRVIHEGGPLSVESMLEMLEPSGHGALEEVEGAVWRVERKGVVDFLGKYVRPSKVDGKYLDGVGGIQREPIYNYHPDLLK
jgi:hypothetical protein